MTLKIALFILSFVCRTNSLQKCPPACTCSLDQMGRWQVLCQQGGLVDPLPVLDMPSETEILIVSAPKERPNALTLGPIFRGLQSLEEVHVVNSKVPALGEHSFWGLRKLYLLNVSHNSISSVRDTNFKGPDALKELDLSYNHIESVPSAVFRHLKLLRILDLSHNRVPELAPKVFFSLSSVEYLDLSHNPLGNLPHDRFSDLPNLKTFKCIGCGLLTVSESFMSEIKRIEYLDFTNNRLTSVPPLKETSNLVILKINGNLLSKLSTDELSESSLEEFYSSHNRITAIEEETFENTTLTVVDLSYNRLSHLESPIFSPVISTLKELSLSGNALHIDQLEEILPKARQLRHLAIGDLGLTRLPSDLLRRSRHLRYLNISSNYLSKFPHELLYSTPHLQSLDLSANSFRGLNHNVISAFSAMSSLVSVRLEKNPWQCQECHISTLLHWLKNSPKQPHFTSSCDVGPPFPPLCLKCVGPEHLAGQAIVFLKEENLSSCASAAHSLLPGWHEGESDMQNDNPRSSINKRNGNDDSTHFTGVAAFFKDHLALLIGVACGLVLSIMLVVITALICSRRQTAYYYTSEEDSEKKEKLVGHNNNDSPVASLTAIEPTNVPPYEQMAISKVHAKTPIVPGHTGVSRQIVTASVIPKKRPEIATIEEVIYLDS